jgi:hypothetical protein
LVLDRTPTLDRVAPWVRTNIPFSRGLVIPADGHYHSVYPIGQSVLAAPLIAPAAFLLGVDKWEVPRQVYFARITEKLIAALMTSLAVLAIFLALRPMLTARWTCVLTLLFGLGTVAWPIASQALWQQTGGQLCVALALYLFARWLRQQDHFGLLLLMGLCCAMAIFVRPVNLLLVGALLLPIFLWHRSLISTGALLLLPAIATCVLVAYNLHIYGNILGGYGQFASLRNDHPVRALAGILVSPGRGLFFFSPALLLALAAPFLSLAWQAPMRSLVLACLTLIAGQLLVISNWGIWWGGCAWGWRLLAEIGPPLILLSAVAFPVISDRRLLQATFLILVAASVGIQAVGALWYPGGGWDLLPYPVDETRVWDWMDNPISRCLHAGVDRQPYRSAGRLLDAETWTLANTWREMSADDIAMSRWWTIPPPAVTTFPDAARLAALARQQSKSCYLDVATLKLTGEGTSWSLNLVGWAFDAASGTSPDRVFVEISSPGRKTDIAAARRWERPDVAHAFHNDRLLSAGVAADVRLQQPASSVYDVKILQIVANGLAECVPARGHVVVNK